MTTFKTDRRPTAGYIFKDWLIIVGIFSLAGIYGLLFPGKPFIIKESYFFIVGGSLLAGFLARMREERLYEMYFDLDKRQIVFLYKSLFSDPKQKTLSFDNARLEINESKPKWWRRAAMLTLSFREGKKEVFNISKYKDGFSIDTLREICKRYGDLIGF
jgi:hypothetical protein